MSQKSENTKFICEVCKEEVLPLTNGSYRNHCPYCLHSIHLDNSPGDRISDCRGIMEPIKVILHLKKGMQIIHRCKKCGHESINKAAIDTDNPDNYDLLLNLMNK